MRALGVLVALAALAALAAPVAALTFAPALLLLAVLAAGLRPGEATLLRLRARRTSHRPARAPRLPLPRLGFVASYADRLRAAAIAVRPPPAPAL